MESNIAKEKGKMISGTNTYKVRMCTKCNKRELVDEARFKACSRCKITYYCSVECQHSDWPVHKQRCKEQKELLDENGGQKSFRNLSNSALVFAQNRYVHIIEEMRKCKVRTKAIVFDMILYIENGQAQIPISNKFSIITVSDLLLRRNLPTVLEFLFSDDFNFNQIAPIVRERRASLTAGMFLILVVNPSDFDSGCNIFRCSSRAPNGQDNIYTDEIVENPEKEKQILAKFWPDHPKLKDP